MGACSSATSGISVELGFATMFLSVVWHLFRQKVMNFQLRMAAAVFSLRTPTEAGQLRAAERVGASLCLLLFLLGLLVLIKLVLARS
jgi:hypothetical protein